MATVLEDTASKIITHGISLSFFTALPLASLQSTNQTNLIIANMRLF